MAVHNDHLPPAEKLMLARTRLLSRDPFYGHLCMNIDWVESKMSWAPEHLRTMAVRIKADHRIELIWNPEFVATQTMHEVYGAIMHELEHVVHLHCVRTGGRDPKDWNVAVDMVVNGTRSKPQIGYLEDDQSRTLPMGGKLIFRPDGVEWEPLTAEQLFKKINEATSKRVKCPTCGGKGRIKSKPNQQGQQSGQPQGQQPSQQPGNQPNGQQPGNQPGQQGNQPGSGGDQPGSGGDQQSDEACPTCGGDGEVSRWGTSFDDHSTWNTTEVSRDEARQIVQEAVKDAVEKSRGRIPGHLVSAIEKLKEPKVPWREKLRRFLGNHCGGRRSTWNRPARRRENIDGDNFGIKGISHHAVGEAVVVVDTSGSISNDDLRQFFAEIEAMLARIRVSILQWDFGFQDWWPKYRRLDWKRIKIKGRGGTDMAAPIKWLIDNDHIPKKGPVIMLTDGICNYHDKCDFPYIVVITSKDGKEPSWGEVVHLKED